MATITRTTDPKGRVSLPKGFASSTVLIEQISATELRIRKARVVPEETLFREEKLVALSDRDRDRFIEALENPPRPTKALKELGSSTKSRGKRRHG